MWAWSAFCFQNQCAASKMRTFVTYHHYDQCSLKTLRQRIAAREAKQGQKHLESRRRVYKPQMFSNPRDQNFSIRLYPMEMPYLHRIHLLVNGLNVATYQFQNVRKFRVKISIIVFSLAIPKQSVFYKMNVCPRPINLSHRRLKRPLYLFFFCKIIVS